MEVLNGKYNSAKVFNCTELDSATRAQIHTLLNNEVSKDSNIVVMPDTHVGKGCVVGLTMTVTDKIMPNLVGVDIGCGVNMTRINAEHIEFQHLDKCIRENVPSGFSIRETPHKFADLTDIDKLKCANAINLDRAYCSIGTLGGGNHFIELDRDDEGNTYLTIHSGSRHLGVEVVEYYLKEGAKVLKEKGITDVPYELTYLTDELKEDYLHDMFIVQDYADWNRRAIRDEICKYMKWYSKNDRDLFVATCVHNYVSDDNACVVLRKGAISSREGERVIIPINMRDGIIIGTGLGNPEWNCSAPHGAGRLFSRKQAKQNFTVSQFKSTMDGVYCSCINPDTLDEAPFVYRDINDILNVIGETVKVDKIIKPIYSFKASETRKW